MYSLDHSIVPTIAYDSVTVEYCYWLSALPIGNWFSQWQVDFTAGSNFIVQSTFGSAKRNLIP
jgi:hypothetical protein